MKWTLTVRRSIVAVCGSFVLILCLAEKADPFITHRVVVLRADEGPTPTRLVSVADTTIIWINYSELPVEIYFSGNEAAGALTARVHFGPAEDGGYVSKPIPYGSIASLCFVRLGTYEYVVRRVGPPDPGSKEFHATIIIK